MRKLAQDRNDVNLVTVLVRVAHLHEQARRASGFNILNPANVVIVPMRDDDLHFKAIIAREMARTGDDDTFSTEDPVSID